MLPATKYVKSAVFEMLCEPCAEYALRQGARDATPFSVKHPVWSVVLFGVWRLFVGVVTPK